MVILIYRADLFFSKQLDYNWWRNEIFRIKIKIPKIELAEDLRIDRGMVLGTQVGKIEFELI